MKTPEYLALLEKYVDGTASAEEGKQVLTLIQESSDARMLLARLLYHEKGIVRGFAAIESSGKGDRAASADRGRRRVLWRAITALAASLLISVGIFLWMAGSRPESLVLARVTRVSGKADRISGQVWQALAVGDRLLPGDRILTGPGALLQITSSDGTAVDLNELTAISLGRTGTEPHIRLSEGDVYCDVTPRVAGAVPFVLETFPGYRLQVTGTCFEVSIRGRVATVRMEEGALVVQTPAGSTALAALQQIRMGPDTGALQPRSVMLHEIAGWHFGTQTIPAGSILFADDFEDGMGKWIPVQPGWAILNGQGVSNSHCLALGPPAGRTNEECFIVPRFLARYKNFEVTWLVYRAEDSSFQGSGLMWLESLDPIRGVDSEYAATYLPPEFPPDSWVAYKLTVRGDRLNLFMNGDKCREGRILGPYKYIGLLVNLRLPQDKSALWRIDRFTIRKLPEEPAGMSLEDKRFAVRRLPTGSGAMLFEDDFEADLSRWEVSGSGVDLVEGKGVDGSRCLRFRLPPGAARSFEAVPRLRDFISNFEVSFDAFIEHPANLSPAMSAGISLRFPPGIPLPQSPAEGVIDIPRNTWFRFLATVRGTEYSCKAYRAGQAFGTRTLKLTTSNLIPYIGFGTDDGNCRFLVDNFRIRRLAEP